LGQAQLFRHILETVMPQIVVHATHPTRTRQYEQIQQPIVVVIDERDSAARGLDDELFASVAAVGKLSGQAGFGGDVAKIRTKLVTEQQRGAGDCQ
jgi:hypothetical protein